MNLSEHCTEHHIYTKRAPCTLYSEHYREPLYSVLYKAVQQTSYVLVFTYKIGSIDLTLPEHSAPWLQQINVIPAIQ